MRHESWRAGRLQCIAIGSALLIAALPQVAPAQRVTLVINHLAVVLDSATYHDVRVSPLFLKSFAAIDSGRDPTLARGDIALLGQYNFLQLGAPHAGATPANAGDVAVVFGVEKAGGLDALATLMGLPIAVQVTPREFIREPPPAYSENGVRVVTPAAADAPSARARIDIMQYGELTAAKLSESDSRSEHDFSTARFLEPYFDHHKLMSQLTGATLAIPAADIAKISHLLQRDSVNVVAQGQGAIITLDGFVLRLVPDFVGAGVKQLRFGLTDEFAGDPVFRFGARSRLQFGPGAIAVWDF